jgi:hypothetical protein
MGNRSRIEPDKSFQERGSFASSTKEINEMACWSMVPIALPRLPFVWLDQEVPIEPVIGALCGAGAGRIMDGLTSGRRDFPRKL